MSKKKKRDPQERYVYQKDDEIVMLKKETPEEIQKRIDNLIKS